MDKFLEVHDALLKKYSQKILEIVLKGNDRETTKLELVQLLLKLREKTEES
jgi:hypothetical protein